MVETDTDKLPQSPQELPLRQFCYAAQQLDEDYASAQQEQYIVPCNRLMHPEGRAMKRRRGQISRFMALPGGWSFEELAPDRLDAAYQVERLWQREDGRGEAAFARRCFRSFAHLSLIGGLLYSAGEAVGYSIAAPCGESGALLLLLRAKAVPAGGSAMLYRQTALLLRRRLPGLALVNLGCCGGGEEHKNRMAYHPWSIVTPTGEEGEG